MRGVAFMWLGGQVVRRRDRMRTFAHFCDSFTGWYACAIGYNSVEEMLKNASTDDDVKKQPSEIELYDFLTRRYASALCGCVCV